MLLLTTAIPFCFGTEATGRRFATATTAKKLVLRTCILSTGISIYKYKENLYCLADAATEEGSATRIRPSSRKIFNKVVKFGVVFPDSILATEECGSPHRSAE